MTEQSANKNFKRVIVFISGCIVLIFGIALVLKWWFYVSLVFKGVIGGVLALSGLFLLALARE